MPGKNFDAAGMLSRGRARVTGSSRTENPEMISEVVDESSSRVVDRVAADAVNDAPAAPVAQRYVKVAASLTPDLRRWIKDTPGRLHLDGVSGSDVVRLALTRLRAEVGDEELADLLVEQAHREAAEMSGRKNRGLPSR